MWWLIAVGIAALVYGLIRSASNSGASASTLSSNDSQDIEPSRSQLFNDDDTSSSSVINPAIGLLMAGALDMAGNLFDSNSSSSMSPMSNSITDCTPSINSANGLPMMGCVDIEGNPYGTDLSHEHSISSSSIFDDSISSSSSSLFDDSSFSSSSSLFDD